MRHKLRKKIVSFIDIWLNAVLIKVAQNWFKRFQSGNFDIEWNLGLVDLLRIQPMRFWKKVKQDRHINSYNISEELRCSISTRGKRRTDDFWSGEGATVGYDNILLAGASQAQRRYSYSRSINLCRQLFVTFYPEMVPQGPLIGQTRADGVYCRPADWMEPLKLRIYRQYLSGIRWFGGQEFYATHPHG
ncbi:hypothetical protein EVAR_3539_1 [Eumeta japonica]|uniref:Uncharacterized protein n=1 Tax=Eumeta variegata TaxID=151549 RepID=A0A4C1SV99_EUMVA|nr:hypothetical protein EVAR_3539_1 [Eumeta japonica]